MRKRLLTALQVIGPTEVHVYLGGAIASAGLAMTLGAGAGLLAFGGLLVYLGLRS